MVSDEEKKEELEKRRRLAEAAEQEKLQIKIEQELLIDSEVKQVEPEDEAEKIADTTVTFKVPRSNEIWEEILAAYREKYQKEPNENGALLFNSMEEVKNFFAEQAKAHPGKSFLIQEVDGESKSTGYHIYSCGDGDIYDGTFLDIKEQLEKKLGTLSKDDPEYGYVQQGLAFIDKMITPNPTPASTQMKERLKELTEPEEEQGHKSSPLSTKPGSAAY